MADINKVSGIAWADIGKLSAIAGTDIAKMAGGNAPAGGVAPTVAVVVVQRSWIMVSTTEGFASGTWSAYQANGRTNDTQRNVEYGLQPDGTGTWISVMNKTARPMRIAQMSGSNTAPSSSVHWTEVNPTGEAAFDIVAGVHTGTGPATDAAAFVHVGNDAEYASYFGGGALAITTPGDWENDRPINSDLATSKILTGVGFNHSIADPLFVAVSNTGRVFSSATGGDDTTDWTTRYGTTGTSGGNNSEDEALWEVAYGNDKWVAVGYYDKMEHITGSGDATSWGIMNLPGNLPGGVTKRQMLGVDSDGNNNWVTCGASGYIWVSTDNAATWAEHRIANADDGYGTWQCVKYDGANTWWLTGGKGYLAYSTNMTDWTGFRTPVTDVNNSTSYGIAFNSVRTA